MKSCRFPLTRRKSRQTQFTFLIKKRSHEIRPEPTIISIDPGTNEMVVSVFQGYSPEYSGVKAFALQFP
ncbi:MAG: hypothetical protein A2161_01235 [Candidatus Schekmanbacteria bacterium RBG_13_48_7]|uniref:Uncharacterized protein n=1 Tax=Candidatus Schekmanbacteria bacterium RBG_13_48_7 TaxID=1817878 RepID=A0A1F7RYT9_9BACT|nr:MAG: hypothetical protein A2161_01235 [Candidatus Schekmanbacteria bacterium RBG_13_48_7]